MIGQSVGSDASPLSCFLFRPRKSREKRRKRSHINASNASVIRTSRVSQTPLQAPFPTSINGYHAAKKLLSQSPAKRPTFAFAGESGYTLAFANRIAHSGLHAETGAFRTGPLLLLSERFTRFGNPAWPGVRTANFAAFGSWSEALLKDTESLRDSDALMRVAVPRRRGPAGLRDLFRFCRNCGLYALRSGPFRVCEARGGITTLGALCVFSKRWTTACQKGSFAAFCDEICQG